MDQNNNEIYALVDEEFMSLFKGKHLQFMKSFYYEKYSRYCNMTRRSALSEPTFFSNMHLRRLQLFQLCCPYCGAVEVFICDKRLKQHNGLNFCTSCGRGSTIKRLVQNISRFKRIKEINNIGLTEQAKKRPEREKWLLAYDCYQIEIIELASIIEVINRDSFEAMLFICNPGEKQNYMRSVVLKNAGNDFMNVEKANTHFKHAFEVDLKSSLDNDVWNDLVDITNLRNMFVHNNGMVDSHFMKTPSYSRLKDHVKDNLYQLEDKDVQKYLKSVIDAVVKISNLFLGFYYSHRNSVIANYYFNLIEKDETKTE